MLKNREEARNLLTVLCLTALLLTFGIAQADNHRGILGRQAPELELNNWIDGAGDPVPAIRLSCAAESSIYTFFRTGVQVAIQAASPCSNVCIKNSATIPR